MSSDNEKCATDGWLHELLATSTPPRTPTKENLGGPKAAKKEQVKEQLGGPKTTKKEQVKEKKYPFTSTITAENKRRFANYQAYKPGGAQSTDVLNIALKRFFDANKQYADADAGEK